MKAASEQFNLWSNFNNMLSDAEQKFFASEYAQALELWQEYAKITGSTRWKKIADEIDGLIKEFQESPTDAEGVFAAWINLRGRMKDNSVNTYSFQVMQKFYAKWFLKLKQTVGYDLATGIFCFIDDKNDYAIDNLKIAINHKQDSVLGRIYLSKAYFKSGNEPAGLARLTQSLFLAANELIEEDFGIDAVKNLWQKLNGLHGKNEVAAWLTTFETWHRGWLAWHDDRQFFQLMQFKERNERILQVKYYLSEKYRHFMRCLYIAEYVRLYLPKERGIIWEQEAYMEKLDKTLFERYRKKRKPVV